jgi:hypothetical protein
MQDEVSALNSLRIGHCTVDDMRQYSFKKCLIREGLMQNAHQTGFYHLIQREVNVSKGGVGNERRNKSAVLNARIIHRHLIELICSQIVGNQTTERRKEHSAAIILVVLDDFPEGFYHPVTAVTGIDGSIVCGTNDAGAARGTIALLLVAIDQFLSLD